MKVNRRPGYVEAKYGNNAFGHKVYASHSDTSGVAGLGFSGVGAKGKVSVGYQGGTYVDHEKIDATYGVGANLGSEVIPGIVSV